MSAGSDFQSRSAGLCLPRRVPGSAAHALAPSLVQILDLKPHCSSLLAETLLPLINGKATGRVGPGVLGGGGGCVGMTEGWQGGWGGSRSVMPLLKL